MDMNEYDEECEETRRTEVHHSAILMEFLYSTAHLGEESTRLPSPTRENHEVVGSVERITDRTMEGRSREAINQIENNNNNKLSSVLSP